MHHCEMIVTDLDGTLLKNDKTISEYTTDIIRRVKKADILFAVATARPIRAVKEHLPFINFDIGIFHNGAVILEPNGNILNIGIGNSYEIIKKILIDKQDCHIAVEINDEMYANFDADRIWKGLIFNYTASFDEIQNMTADKIIIEVNSIDSMEHYNKYLDEHLYLQLSEHTVAMIMNKSATKLNAIQYIVEKYGMDLKNVISFGDDYNDIEMIKGCGKGIAMGNALDEVKAAADDLCEVNENDGVAKWIDSHVL